MAPQHPRRLLETRATAVLQATIKMGITRAPVNPVLGASGPEGQLMLATHAHPGSTDQAQCLAAQPVRSASTVPLGPMGAEAAQAEDIDKQMLEQA